MPVQRRDMDIRHSGQDVLGQVPAPHRCERPHRRPEDLAGAGLLRHAPDGPRGRRQKRHAEWLDLPHECGQATLHRDLRQHSCGYCRAERQDEGQLQAAHGRAGCPGHHARALAVDHEGLRRQLAHHLPRRGDLRRRLRNSAVLPGARAAPHSAQHPGRAGAALLRGGVQPQRRGPLLHPGGQVQHLQQLPRRQGLDPPLLGRRLQRRLLHGGRRRGLLWRTRDVQRLRRLLCGRQGPEEGRQTDRLQWRGMYSGGRRCLLHGGAGQPKHLHGGRGTCGGRAGGRPSGLLEEAGGEAPTRLGE
mmetsp:Transcript_37775/g.97918  ORF Transcript_37775/g.97918 Transcript_37775/m.97918 type:complete len:303 (+) Transcript_37775:158-1066(+)